MLPFLGLVGLLFAYYVGFAIYRLFLHPLAKYPGPRLWAVTQWPEAVSHNSGFRHVQLQLAHEKYGDIVRTGPNSLSFRSAQAVHDIYTDRKANLVKNGWAGTSYAMNAVANTHSLIDRPLHAKRRRLLANAFSESALKSMEVYVLQEIRSFCDYMGQAKSKPTPADGALNGSPDKGTWGQPRNIGKWANLLTLDVLGELAFGKSFDAMKQGYHMLGEMLLSSSELSQRIAHLPSLLRAIIHPLVRQEWLISRIPSKTFAQKVEFRATMLPLLKNRFALEEAMKGKPKQDQRTDFMHYLIAAKDPETGGKFAPRDLIGEAALLVGAGSDTSSTALSGIFFYLVRNHMALKKLQTEVRSAFSDVEEIKTGLKLSSLHYLRACIDEGLRMTPPVPGVLSRLILPGGATIDGHRLPEGTSVGAAAYTVHHNEAYFPQSFSYTPERWIPDSKDAPFAVTESSIAHQKPAFIPFSTGPRNCVGKNMAMMELLITVARVMFLFDIRAEPGDHTGEGNKLLDPGRQREGEYQIKDWFIAERDGPILEFRKREILA